MQAAPAHRSLYLQAVPGCDAMPVGLAFRPSNRVMAARSIGLLRAASGSATAVQRA